MAQAAWNSGRGLTDTISPPYTKHEIASDTREGFTSCQTPLTRDCVIQAARESGCSDKGSLIAALAAAPLGGRYDSQLANSSVYRYYMQNVGDSQSLGAVLNDGNVEKKQIAYDQFSALSARAFSGPSAQQNQGVYAAAKDLCVQSGYFRESYDFCVELKGNAIINDTNIECAHKLWKRNGGTSMGKAYPSLEAWAGKTMDSLTKVITDLVRDTKSPTKSVQADAIIKFVGVPTAAPDTGGMNVGPDIAGSETVWIYYGAAVPVIVRCDLLQGVPSIASVADLTGKYKLPAPEGIAFFNAFEYRTPKDETLGITVALRDGFMIGFNQNPFQNTRPNVPDWGSWRYQDATTFGTAYNITKDSKAARNVFVTKYFQDEGGAAFQMRFSTTDAAQKLYLTQEPQAPWMQYEICDRPNGTAGTTTGFFEKRWNGPCAPAEKGNVPSFDVTATGVVYQTQAAAASAPGGKAYMTFSGNASSWKTQSMFAFSAFKTITMLIRPSDNLAADARTTIFSFTSPDISPNLSLYRGPQGDYMFDLFIPTVGHNYTKCTVNQWNLVVIHFNGDNGIINILYSVADLPSIKTADGRGEFVKKMLTNQNATGKILMRTFGPSAPKSCGFLQLGGGQGQGFTGDIAWLHGFREGIASDELLEAEATQSWLTRWPGENTKGKTKGNPSYTSTKEESAFKW